MKLHRCQRSPRLLGRYRDDRVERLGKLFQIASRIRLRRVPDLQFFYDESVAHQDRIEKILLDLQHERDAHAAETADSAAEPDAASARNPAEPGGVQGAPPSKVWRAREVSNLRPSA